MEDNHAVLLFLKASCLGGSQPDIQTEACKVVKELYYLPPAIDQAGAFIASGTINIEDFLQNIGNTERSCCPIQNSKMHPHITELSYKFSRMLKVMILRRTKQLIVQCSFWHYLLFCTSMVLYRISFLMLLLMNVKVEISLLAVPF